MSTKLTTQRLLTLGHLLGIYRELSGYQRRFHAVHLAGKHHYRYLALRLNLGSPPDGRACRGRLSCRIQPACKGGEMRFGPFLILGLLLLLAWVGGFVVYHSAGFLIHVLLVLAVISVIVHFLTGTRTSGA